MRRGMAAENNCGWTLRSSMCAGARALRGSRCQRAPSLGAICVVVAAACRTIRGSLPAKLVPDRWPGRDFR
jgi:hypothetical protein